MLFFIFRFFLLELVLVSVLVLVLLLVLVFVSTHDGKSVLWQLVGWVSSGVICVEMVLGNVRHGTRLTMGIYGYWLNPVASVTVLLTETWYFVDVTADVWTHSDRACACSPLVPMISSEKGVITLFHINMAAERV